MHIITRRGPKGVLGTAAIVLLGLAISSCRGPVGSVAFIDPVMAYAAPDAVKQFGRSVDDIIVLPDSGASAALFSAIDATRPRIMYLSPLLASEIGAILARDDETVVVYLGNAEPKPDPRLCAASFSSVDAARLAGELAANECKKRADGSSRVAAVFARSDGDADIAAAAFKTAFEAAGGLSDPYIETVAESFSQATADRLKGLDIGVAYVSAPEEEVERWLSAAFDASTFVLVEYALPPKEPVSSADAIIAWDIGATLKLLDGFLDGSVDTDGSGPMSGLWRIIMVQSKRIL